MYIIHTNADINISDKMDMNTQTITHFSDHTTQSIWNYTAVHHLTHKATTGIEIPHLHLLTPWLSSC